ncbi:hypothetical protein ig2599ANME_0467 [groundwater metagenome]
MVLTPLEPIPQNIGVIITTEEESHNIDFSSDRIIIADGRPQAALDRACSLLYAEEFDEIIIGIDPGKYPGVAVLGNGKTISVYHVSAGEVCPLIKRISDIIAAINIARIKGKSVGKQFIEPSQGEVRVIQEHSREHSNGRSTIPRLLARAVAKGEMTLEEAVERHNGF